MARIVLQIVFDTTYSAQKELQSHLPVIKSGLCGPARRGAGGLEKAKMSRQSLELKRRLFYIDQHRENHRLCGIVSIMEYRHDKEC